MDNVVVYTKDGCTYCVKAKELLNQNNILFNEIKVGNGCDIGRDEFISKYPSVKTLPYIKINDDVIGGYSDLVEWMNNHV